MHRWGQSIIVDSHHQQGKSQALNGNALCAEPTGLPNYLLVVAVGQNNKDKSMQCNCVALPNVGSKRLGTRWKCRLCQAEWIIAKKNNERYWKKR